MRLALLFLLPYLTATVAGPAAAQDEVPPRLDALLAQVVGMGGCAVVHEAPSTTFFREEPVPTPFFPALRLTRAWCMAEHGDSLAAWVAEDPEGVLYLLGSRPGFDFLVRRHHPQGVTEATALAYAQLSLQLQGVLPADAVAIEDTADIPVAVVTRSGLTRSHIGVSHLLPRATGGPARLISLYLAAHDGLSLWSGQVHVTPGGESFVELVTLRERH